ncbi:flagellin [Acetobacterium malicum]|uniref:Flagellin n=1 Tax=Acetobacterium malicum TaxID=52692 RepID=A0ABR6YTL6_9FIRM|nr:flagellin [Acetobacterium malicum]MBC3898532.1 flagellin [Acetobacterium malicum]
MRINHNIPALNSYEKYSSKSNSVTKSLEKLSSGSAINRASDNAAGLAISEKMRGQIRGLDQASSNATDTISLIQTAEGALNETHSALQRIRELSVQAANDTNTASDRIQIQKEVDQLISSIDDTANNTEFNTKKLLNGSLGIIPAKPATPGTAKLDANTGGLNKTVEDGWIALGDYGDKIRINPDEQILKSGTYHLNVEYRDHLPIGLDISEYPSGLIVTNSHFETPPVLSYTFNGVTIDISGSYFPSNAPGSAGTGTFVLYAGDNGSPATPEIDNSLYTQIGANTNQNLKLDINNMNANSLGIDPLDITTQSNANTAISAVDSAITLVSSERGKLGAVQNRLEHAIANNNISSENLSSSESRIRDVDMAAEMMKFTKEKIISQAAQSMLAQANQQPENILQLLQ